MMRKTGHLHMLCHAIRSFGLHDTQNLSTNHGILAIHLIEITYTEKQNRIRMLCLDVKILLHQWGFHYLRHAL